MARKMMTKEVTKTTVKLGRIAMVDGTPKVEHLADELLLGNVSMKRAQSLMNKKHGIITVFEVVPETNVYEMAVEKFIELADLKITEDKK